VEWLIVPAAVALLAAVCTVGLWGRYPFGILLMLWRGVFGGPDRQLLGGGFGSGPSDEDGEAGVREPRRPPPAQGPGAAAALDATTGEDDSAGGGAAS
jgi:hypothetical protein